MRKEKTLDESGNSKTEQSAIVKPSVVGSKAAEPLIKTEQPSEVNV